VRYRDVPPKERKLAKSKNLRGLREFILCKEVNEKIQEGFFQHSWLKSGLKNKREKSKYGRCVLRGE